MSQLPPGFVLDTPAPRRSGGGNVFTLPKSASQAAKEERDAQAAELARQKAERDAHNEELRNQREQDKLIADLYLKGLRPGANGVPEPIPGWTPPPSENAPKSQNSDEVRQRLSRINALVGQINRVQELYDTGPGTTKGFPSGLSDYLPTDANAAFDTAGASLSQQGLGAFRIPGSGTVSDRDAIMFDRANMPTASTRDAAIEEQLRGMRARVDQELAGMNAPAAQWRQQGAAQGNDSNGNPIFSGNGPTGNSPPPASPWDNPNTAKMAVTGATKTVADPQLSNELFAMWKQGQPFENIDAYAQSKGAQPMNRATFDAAVKHYGAKGQNPFNATHEVPTSGMERTIGANQSGAALGSGYANMLTGGRTDEIAGLAAALSGGDYTQARDAFDANKKLLAYNNPNANLAGELAGGVTMGVAGPAALSRLAPGLAGPAANLLARAPGWVAPVAGGAAQGAYYGSGENNQDRIGGAQEGAVAGGIGGAIGYGGANIVGSMVAPTGGAALPLYERGVRPTMGQRAASGGVFGQGIGKAEEALQSVPFLGAAIARARQIPRDQFQVGGFNKALGEINQSLPAGMGPGAEAQAFARDAFGDAYDTARSGMQFRPDQTYINDLNTFQDKLNSGLYTQEQADQINRLLESSVGSRLANSGNVLNGDAFKAAGTELGSTIGTWGKSGTTASLADALKEYRTIFDNAARRNSVPEAVQMLDQADRGYAQLVRLQRAADLGGTGKKDAGAFTPIDLLNAVKKEGGGVRSSAYNQGKALMQDYAEAGKSLADTLPNSGTVDRLLTGQVAAGSGAAALGIPAAAMLKVAPVFAPYLPGANKAVTGLLAPREVTLPPSLSAPLVGARNYIKRNARKVGIFGGSAAVPYFLGP